jgi:putative exosortase-associated protein (TIGR04073 family)
MRKILAVIGAFVLIFSLTAYVHAEGTDNGGTDMSGVVLDTNEVNYANTPLDKFSRGAINTATCWAEVPADIAKVSQDTNLALGLTYGTAKGVVTGLGRGFFGVIDIVTCIFPPYNQPKVAPEYAYERADENIRAYLW